MKIIHVQFSSDDSTYGEPGEGQTPKAWKREADRHMVSYLGSLGYRVEREPDGPESACWLEEGHLGAGGGQRLMEDAWSHACANGSKRAP